MLVYHFVPATFGLQNIEKRRLKIATIDDLNDPFELLAYSQQNRQFRNVWRNTRSKLAQNNWMLCFSANWENPVQWSHYADKHKGVCLGFEVPDANLMQVHYVANRLNPDMTNMTIGSPATKEVARSSLCTKFSHWAYEQEWRVWVDIDHSTRQNGLYFVDFSENLALREIIVGHCSEITRSQLQAALGQHDNGIEKFKARLAFQTFKVTRQQNDSKWK